MASIFPRCCGLSESVLSAPTRTIAFPVKILLLFLEIELCLYKSERKCSQDCAMKNQKTDMFYALKTNARQMHRETAPIPEHFF